MKTDIKAIMCFTNNAALDKKIHQETTKVTLDIRFLTGTIFKLVMFFVAGSLASQTLAEKTTFQSPATAEVGSQIAITLNQAKNPNDFITIVPKNAQEGSDAGEGAYESYEYVISTGPIFLTVGSVPGEYEIRLLEAQSPYRTIAKRPISLIAVSVTLNAPNQVTAGAPFQVKWKGPGNAKNYLSVSAYESPDQAYISYEYTRENSTITFVAPDLPGKYEVRYFLGGSDQIIARRLITVDGATASVTGPKTAVAGTSIKVNWTGPNNDRDYITIVPKSFKEGTWDQYAYTQSGNPLTVLAPQVPGEYELRYATGQSYITLASAPITITPAQTKPGILAVTPANAAKNSASDKAVEVILDASGSMLQSIKGVRRIDIAKQTLIKLTSETIPAGTLFAFRVFGREVDSCQSDLDIPLAPLDPKVVVAKLNTLTAKNNAKTPIAASLENVKMDLLAAKGEKLVILVTDGEETCGGDPAATIEKLRASGVQLRVNIVGFAIDDEKLKTAFAHWANAGGGSYFDAKDAAGLNSALRQALKPAFEVINTENQVVAEGFVGGNNINLLPGEYSLRLKGKVAALQKITIKSESITNIQLE